MEQIKTLVGGLSGFQRVSVAIGALIAAAGIAAITHYQKEADFHPLYTNMAPEDAGPVVQKLKESGVEYRLGENGSSVLVHSDKIAESRIALAGAGLPKSGRIGFELFDKTTFGATELVEHINYQRALEGELERSIMAMDGVTASRVHLTMPKESVFLDQQQAAKASVMVKLKGGQLSQQNVVAITNLIASAVDGLTPDAVAVLDMDGNLLNRPRRGGNDDSQVTTEALDVRRQIEHDLVQKIDATLQPLLGTNKFRAGASVDCDLTSGDQQEETFDPEKSVMVSSQKIEDGAERASSAGGIPGTAANLPNPNKGNGGGTSGGNSHRTENITYQSSRVIRHTRIPQGVIRRMSLSILVGQDTRMEGDAKNKHRIFIPPSADTLEKIKTLVGGVTGFNKDRGDQLIVETLPFESNYETDVHQNSLQAPKPTSQDPQWLQILKRYQMQSIGGLVGLALLSIVLRLIGARRGSKEAADPEIGREIERAAGSAGVAFAPVAAVPGASAATEGPAAVTAAAAASEAQDTAELSAGAKAVLSEAKEETIDKVRQIAQRDMAATANVLRMWLDQKA